MSQLSFRRRDWHRPRAWAALLLAATAAHGAQFKGTVHTSDGEPANGVMVTLIDAHRGLCESVFSDQGGRFELATSMTGALSVRLRKPYLRDLTRPVRVSAGGSTTAEFTMVPMTSAQEISESLPALFHFGHIPFKEGTRFDRSDFQRDCLTCHQLGNAYTRRVLPASGWAVIVRQMHGWLGNFDERLREERAELLAAAFDGRPLTVRPIFPVDPVLRKAKITEYRLDRAVVPHDAEFNPGDGRIYTVDEGADQIAITDLQSGETRYVPEPASGSPAGGKFGQPFLFNMAVSRGPHSLALDKHGRFYVTDAFAGALSSFDTIKQQWEPPHNAGKKALYPHTVRVDGQGRVWFTIAYSDQIGRFDPATGQIEVRELPPLKPVGIAAQTVPYGIDVNPVDGSVWYARLYGDKIGRIDPASFTMREFDSPVKAPRRLRFDKAGTLWVAGFDDGELAKIHTNPFTAKVYKLPQFAPGYVPAPYAVGIDPRSQDVWINEVMTDHMYRFIPSQERFIAYPMPLRSTYTREITFTRDGRVCASNNPVPKAALEGGVLELICIDPAAQGTDKPAHGN